MFRRRTEILVSVALVVVTLAAFWPVRQCDFVNYDDSTYVTDNPHVRVGLTRAGAAWAFTFYASNWHPLTWLSLQLDATLFGVDSKAFHLTNLTLHVVNVLLLFVLLRWLTGAVWRSALVAALFAVHPLHVESVAWVAERKDVLSTLFWLLTIAAYAFYARRPGVVRYLLVMIAFILGLMAKPMLVTLPFVLLLLDYWPLQRTGVLRLILEKTPLFLLSAACCVVTMFAQQRAVKPLHSLGVPERVFNAVAAYGGYLEQTFRPIHLCILYPHAGSALPLGRVITGAVILLVVSAVVLWKRHDCPYLLVGWLWYLGTLLPVIGLVQVGEQAMADRYTYVPLIGVFVMLAWGLPDLLTALRIHRSMLVFPALILLAICAGLTWLQVRVWHDSISLWKQAVTVDPNNATAHNSYGSALFDVLRVDSAEMEFKEAFRLRPNDAKIRNNLGLIHLWHGDLSAAVQDFQTAIELRPTDWLFYTNLGTARCQQKRYTDAADCFNKALKLRKDARNYFHLAYALSKLKKESASEDEYEKGRKCNLGWPIAISTRAWILATDRNEESRNGAEAVMLAEEACQATNYLKAKFLDILAAAYAETGRFDNAQRTARAALTLAEKDRNFDLADKIQARLRCYERREPYRE